MVVGEGCPFLCAMIVLNKEHWIEFAKSMDVDPDPQSLQNKVVVNAITKRIEDQIHEFPGYAQIRRVWLSLEPWTVENNLITPTMKLKRNVICDHFKEQIKKLYEGHSMA